MEDLLEKLERDPESHKGDNGRVGVIAGSKDYAGAPALSAKAALRTGCDLAKILTSRAVAGTVASYSENFIVDSYRSSYFDRDSLFPAEELAVWSDAVVVGPGFSRAHRKSVRKFVSSVDVPLVIDAEAIEPALEADLGDAVLTPHQGEAEVIKEHFGGFEEFAKEKEVVLVVKGPTDEIYTPEPGKNETGSAGMTVGGTGDVLTGIIASLISQGLELGEAAKLGAWINGRAGEEAYEDYGIGMTATDLAELIPFVLQD
ncbi:MAG: NAD(P)H-hydrate dehydratase [Candidatus Nanohaloarchaea archaeon]